MAHWFKKVLGFVGNEKGNVALLFGLTLVPVVGATGVAVDYSKASNMKTSLQSEVDAAALEVAKIAVEVHTGATTSSKTPAERQALIDAAIVTTLAARKTIAQSIPSLDSANFTYVGEWADTLKTEYRVTATSNVKKYIRILNSDIYTPVSSSATARIKHEAKYNMTVPSMISPGYDAGDYNRIYAYCYNKDLPVVSDRRTQMTAVTSNGVYTGGKNKNKKEIDVNPIFKDVVMPNCDPNKGESLSWRLYNVRDARTTQSRWPTDTQNATTKVWTQADASGENTTGTPQQRTLFNYHSDTLVDTAGIESFQFVGDQLGYYAPITMMETQVCTTQDLCNPYKPGSQVPFGPDRTPVKASTKCEPGKFMYIGFEDRPYIPGRSAAEYSTWGSGYWTDRDYEDITFVISCPVPQIESWDKQIALIK